MSLLGGLHSCCRMPFCMCWSIGDKSLDSGWKTSTNSAEHDSVRAKLVLSRAVRAGRQGG
jgi:hypothetical protein